MVATSRTRAISASAVAFLTLVALGLRVQRLDWQPLWWDEGYSVYFATESLSRMVWLTAHDIHPPLYYGLLHGWQGLFGGPNPVSLRLFSVTLGVVAIPLMAWLASSLFTQRPRLVLLATLLLTISPIQIFYSQEIRMYGLALVLGITATTLFWKLVTRPTLPVLLGYVWSRHWAYTRSTILHSCCWPTRFGGSGRVRHDRRQLWTLLGTFVAIGLLFLPWLVYAGPKLVRYVGDKVTSDQDTPLNLVQYVARHAWAFTAGHLAAADPTMERVKFAGLAALALLAVGAIMWVFSGQRSDPLTNAAHHAGSADPSPYAALWTFTLVPLAIGFFLNLRLPFFPDGGERLLLMILPSVLLLIAAAIDELWSFHHLGKVAAALLAVSCVFGIVTFYTTPRYADHDYRPLIGQIVQQGREGDTFVAVFPWQLGFWRAYAHVDGAEPGSVPSPVLVSDSAAEWGLAVKTVLDSALANGAVWFPAPLSFGSTLPGEIEGYLAQHATNLANRWVSPAIRLSAWRSMPTPGTSAQAADFGPVSLIGAGVLPNAVSSDNSPLAITLAWQTSDESTESATAVKDLAVTMRLRDGNGRVWASRDYAPLGSLSADAPALTTGQSSLETVGLIVPAGLAPDRYEVSVGVSLSGTKTLLYPAYSAAETDPLVAIGEVDVTQPESTQPTQRLPVQHALTPPEVRDGFAFLGFAGIDSVNAQLAGTDVEITLFLQNQRQEPSSRHLYLSILDDAVGVGGWEGWMLPNYPTETWPDQALVQAPVPLHIPATLVEGEYGLIVGLLDPLSGEKSPPVQLGKLSVKQRTARFSPPNVQTAVDPAVQFGTHAELIGYDLDRDPDENKLYLTLHWQVLQTLLPPHHIFVHLDNTYGDTIAQDDGPPFTATGRAPTGSWLPSEFVSTVHTITLPSGQAINNSTIGELRLQVGLYNPDGNIRLPTSVDGQPTGDSADLSIP